MKNRLALAAFIGVVFVASFAALAGADTKVVVFEEFTTTSG